MERIGRYEIISELGRGAMGIVYRARDTKIGRDVAIKTIRLIDQAAPSETTALKERLFREAQSAGRLSHPGIVTIYDVAEEGGLAYITMEFVEGRTLEELMEQGEAAETAFIADFLKQTAAALDYAHGKDIVHRDVKPANMMVTPERGVKITDFGIARITSSKLTQTGMVMGTPNYMSPEQVRGDSISGRSDQFSLGVIAYELLTGRKPFVADSLTAVIFKIASAEPTPPRQINPALSPEVETAILKGLAKDPKDRYASCGEFAEVVAACREQLPAAMPISDLRTRDKVSSKPGAPASATAETDPSIEPPQESEGSPAQLQETQPAIPRTVEKLPPLARKTAPKEEGLDTISRREPTSRWAWVWVPVMVVVAIGIAALWLTWPVEPPDQAVRDEQFKPPAPPAEIMAAIEQRMREGPPPPRVVTVSFASSQPGATVVIDGNSEKACTTPCSLEVSPGGHTAVASLAEYLDEQSRFDVGLEPVDLKFELRPVPPTVVRFASKQRGARVAIEGKMESACTTPCSAELRRGSYKATASLFGYYDDAHAFEVGPDPMDVNFDLRPLPPTPIQFTSNREGARVVVDGKVQWSCTMPCSVELPRGTHVAIASLTGYQFVRKTIDVGAEPANQSFDLRAIAGTLSVSSQPPGANIYINGRQRSEKTNAILSLPPGYYLIRVQKAGAGVWEQSVAVRRDEIQALELPLRSNRPVRSKLILTSTPPGADIILNDNNRQGRTPKELDVAPGSYRVTFSLQGYRPVIEEVDVTPNQPARVEVELPRRE